MAPGLFAVSPAGPALFFNPNLKGDPNTLYLVDKNGTHQATTGGVNTICTTAELFPDGTAIDLIRQSQLVCWNGVSDVIAPMIEFGGATYQPADLHPSVEHALRLPASSAPYGTTQSLLNNLAKQPQDRIGVDGASSLTIASFVAATWVRECLPRKALVLNLWSPTGTGDTAVDFLNAVVRRPLQVQEPSIEEIFALPAGLCPTLILDHPSDRILQRIIATSSGRSGRLHAGRLATLRCSIVACTRRPIPGPVLNVSLISAAVSDGGLSSRQMDVLADEFQPQLLRYRLTQHTTIAASQFAGHRFSPAIQAVGHMLGATLEGATDLQEQLVQALAPLDEAAKVQQSAEPAALVLEAILVACHESKSKIFIKEVAKLANTIALGRDDKLALSPKEVGTIVREKLGLETRRQGPGYQLVLDDKLKQRVHDIGRQFGVLTMLQPRPECGFCTMK